MSVPRCPLRPAITNGIASLLCAALLLFAMPAGAFVISEDPFEESSFEIGGALRGYNLWLRGGPLASPSADPDDDPAALSILALRPKLELKRPRFDFVVHDELSSTSSTLPTELLDSTLSVGQGAEAPLWLPLQWTALGRSRFQLRDRIDWLYIRATFGDVSVSVGRQPVSLGRGQIWAPEDLLAPFSPLQLDTEYKSGIDAVRLDWTIFERATLLVIGSVGAREPADDFQVKSDGSALLGRFELAVKELRLGAQAGFVRGDWVGGMDLFVDLHHGSDLHGSGTVTYVPDRARRSYGRAAFHRAVLGTTLQPVDKLLVTAEAHFNGSGAPDPGHYLEEFASPRFAVGEEYNVGRLYAGAAANWEIHPLFSAVVSVIANLEDPSAMLAPELDYNPVQNAVVVAGAFIPVGKGLLYSANGATAQSEFGAYPEIYHADVKLYF